MPNVPDQNRLIEIRVRGLRCLEDVRLRLDSPVTVLIGESGAGKSTLVETFELLRRMSTEGFFGELHNIHGGRALLRAGSDELTIGVAMDGPPGRHEYEIVLRATRGDGFEVARESLNLGPLPGQHEPLRVICRDDTSAKVFDQSEGKLVSVEEVPGDRLLLSSFGLLPPQDAISRARKTLAGIETHVPFEVTPYWAQKATSRPPGLRGSVLLQPADRLEMLGLNLANAYHALINEYGRAHWEETLELIRLGLGPQIESVNVRADPGGAAVSLIVHYRELGPVPAHVLSDGTMAYLALVALVRLPRQRSLLVIDEPDLHLHPTLLGRALDLLELAAEEHPVVVTTHSDRLLDLLESPADSVVLCELEAGARTRLLRPHRDRLSTWLERYRGLGSLRSEGYEPHVMVRESDE